MTTSFRDFDIRSAIPRGVVPFYQPIVSLGDKETICFEVLGRLAVSGVTLAPGQFLPSVEGTPYMAKFDADILTQAIEQVGVWIHSNTIEVHLHVNASKEALVDPGYFDLVNRQLSECGVNPNFLTIEVVETCTFWKSPETLATLAKLQRIGVKVAIDDFPCVSNTDELLHWLLANPGKIDVLKLDRSLVTAACGYDLKGNLLQEKNVVKKLAELRRYVYLAHRLGMSVVAEGIETTSQEAIMRACEVDALQGYHFGKPAPSLQVSAHLRTLPRADNYMYMRQNLSQYYSRV